jgi:hypothetical protein
MKTSCGEDLSGEPRVGSLPERCGVRLHTAALPHPRRGRGADQRALQVVAAPFGQQRGGGFVLHPLRHRLQAELLGETDQHAHERLIVGRPNEVRHEPAVDLDEVDAQPADVAERRAITRSVLTQSEAYSASPSARRYLRMKSKTTKTMSQTISASPASGIVNMANQPARAIG